MSDWAIEYDAALQIAAQHEADKKAIEALSDTLPESVDGGEGADLATSILALVAKDAGSVSEILGAASVTMRETVDLYKGVDEAAEQVFRELEEKIG